MNKGVFLMITFMQVTGFAQTIYWSSSDSRAVKNDYCNYSIKVPQIVIEGADGVFQKSPMNSTWIQNKNNQIADYNKTINDPNYKEVCTENMYSEVVDSNFEIKTPLNSTEIASVLYSDYAYQGGAHGMSFLSADVFNPATAQVYKLADLLIDTPQTTAALKNLILQALKTNEYFDETFGYADWSKTIQSLSQIENFYVTESTIVVFFNQYEVGSYAEGPYFAEIYSGTLVQEGLLKDNSPLKKLFGIQ
jgi:Protein of unknown function (DUF3298)/Deacetylase PdaC